MTISPNHVQSLGTLYTVYSTCVQGRSSVYAAQCITARRRHDAGCTQRRCTLDYDSSWRKLGLTEQLTLREDVSRHIPIAHYGKYLFLKSQTTTLAELGRSMLVHKACRGMSIQKGYKKF